LLGFNRAGAGDDGKLVGSDEAFDQWFPDVFKYMVFRETLQWICGN
jgi:hypothetical protein